MDRRNLAAGAVFTAAALAALLYTTLPQEDAALLQTGDGETRLIVGLDLPLPAQATALHGARLLRVDHDLRFIAVGTHDPPGFLRAAAHNPNIRYVEPSFVQVLLDPNETAPLPPTFEPSPLAAFTPNDRNYSQLYGPQLMGAPAVWSTTVGSPAVKVCVADTGVRYTHEDLVGRWAGGIDLTDPGTEPWDYHGHGQHVTGTIAATINNGKGVAGMANVSFMHAQVLDITGSGSWENVSLGVKWCADNGAHVVSLSLGGAMGSSLLQDAVNYAWGKGAVVVIAAGNSGPCQDCVLYPARYANAIAVSCVAQNRSLCSFSSTGPEVDLAAPGYRILSTGINGADNYVYMSGTSMSTPHVAGAAALLKSWDFSLTNVQIRARLEANAEDLGAPGLDSAFGRGLARVDLAIAGGGNVTPPPPPPPAPSPSPPTPPPPPPTTRGVDVEPEYASSTVVKRGTTTYRFSVKNTGTAWDTYNLTASGATQGWRATVGPSSWTLGPGEAKNVTVYVTAPNNPKGRSLSLQVTAASIFAPATARDSVTAETFVL